MKAKKLLLSFLSILCIAFTSVAVTSCKEEHVHQWIEIERTNATCTKEGSITFICAECGENNDVIIEAKGHTEVVKSAVEPTCTSPGLTEGKYCSTCNEVLVAQEVVPDQHNYVDYVCVACGFHYYTEGLKFDMVFTVGTLVAMVRGYDGDTVNVIIPSCFDVVFDTARSLPVIEIEESAFAGCGSLTSIVIPDGVTTIGVSAFENCNALKTIYYTGTEEQWNAITIEEGNECLSNATIIYNYIEE